MSPTPATRELLEGYRVEALRAIAARQGLASANLDKARIVALILEHWAADRRATFDVSGLDPAALAALHCLQRAGGSLGWEVLAVLLERSGLVDAPELKGSALWSGVAHQPGRPDNQASRTFRDVMARLEVAGLVLGGRSLTGSGVLDFGRATIYHVPVEARERLPAPPPVAPVPAPVAAREMVGDAAALSRELYLVFGHVWRHRPGLTKNLRVTKRALKALLAEMHYRVDLQTVRGEEDIARLWFVRSLLMARGLIRVTQEGPSGPVLEADAAAGRAWWSASMAQRGRDCFEAWLGGSWWNELLRLPGVVWRPAYPDEAMSAPVAVQSARTTVLKALARASSPDGWTSVRQVMDDLFLSQRGFLVPAVNLSPYLWTGARTRYAAGANTRGWDFNPIADAEGGWQTVEGGFVQVVLVGLAWLGVVDLGLDAAEIPVAYRFTQLGRHLLGGGPAPEEGDPGGGRVVLQPNFHILAIGPVPELTLLELEQIAERVSADRAVEFVLTRESVYRGQRAGVDAAAILARLTMVTGSEVPQNVVRSLVEWQSHHERVVVHIGARLLQAAEPAVLDEILGALARRSGWGPVTRLSPTVASLPADDGTTRALAASLVEVDRTARRADGVPAARSVTLDSEGEVHPRQQCPTLAVVGQLQRLADRDEATGRYRLSRASVQRARRDWGLEADAQLASWTAILLPPVPDWLEQRIKTWSGHYGAARLSTAVVLEVADERTLSELREHPALAGRLRQFRVPGATAIVDAADLDAVRAALAELGIEVADGEPGIEIAD